MKQMKIIYAVVLSLLSLVGTMDAKSSVVSASSSWSNREIIGAVCVGGLCVMGVGAIFYINRLEKRIEEQDKRFEAQEKRVGKQDNFIKKQSEVIVENKMQQIAMNESISKLQKKNVEYDSQLITLQASQEKSRQKIKNFKKQVAEVQKWQQDNTFYSMNSSSSISSE